MSPRGDYLSASALCMAVTGHASVSGHLGDRLLLRQETCRD